jgi:hypothetical protein
MGKRGIAGRQGNLEREDTEMGDRTRRIWEGQGSREEWQTGVRHR